MSRGFSSNILGYITDGDVEGVGYFVATEDRQLSFIRREDHGNKCCARTNFLKLRLYLVVSRSIYKKECHKYLECPPPIPGPHFSVHTRCLR